MTAVEFLVKEISEILGPLKTEGMTDLLLLDAYKKAKEMEEQEKIEFACKVAEASAEKYIQGKTTEQIAKELIK